MALNVQPNPLTGPSPLRDIVRPQFHQNNFSQELFIKNELGVKLDKGMYYCVCHHLNAIG
jgi:cleavage and polyadenylation specificity factor subunit 4